MPKLSIRDLELKGLRAFIRVDFNVPLSAASEVADDTRIRATLPTLRYALEHGARLVLASHLGRPKGKPDPQYSLKPVARRLEQLLEKEVAFASDCIGPDAESMALGLSQGGVLLLENLRFHPEEEANDGHFARRLAALCDVYVNDAFGSAHRAHASTAGIARCVSHAAAGLLMEQELTYLDKAVSHPEHPYVVILGGAKVSDKIEVIDNLLPLCDVMLIGGAMAYTFLKARGAAVGKSLVEDDKLDLARKLMMNPKLQLPVDHVVAPRIGEGVETRILDTSAPVPDGWMGLDIGRATIAKFAVEIRKARMVLWNGPMGMFELSQFSAGTMEVARVVAAGDITSIVGGGDSVAALAKAGITDRITHVSTGGGATLAFLGGQKLPGVEALTEK